MSDLAIATIAGLAAFAMSLMYKNERPVVPEMPPAPLRMSPFLDPAMEAANALKQMSEEM